MDSPLEVLRIEWLWQNQGENHYNASCTYVSDELKEYSSHYRLFSQEHDIPTEDSEGYDGQAVTITDLWDKVHEREEILGLIDDADISKLRGKLSKLVDYKKEVATDGGNGSNDDDGGDGSNDDQDEYSSNLQDLISSVSKYTDQRRILAKLVPRELGEDILHRAAARIRVVWTSCENYSGGIEECREREQKYSRTIPDQGGPKYTGPVHAYTPLNKFEEGVVEYQCRSPITCIWRKTDEISGHGDIVNKMMDAGWRKSFLDQKRYVIVNTQQGPKPIKNETDTTSKADPEGITAQAADAILKSEQWHIRLFGRGESPDVA